MRLAGIGDNVVDCYVDEGIMFPGGNALNVAVSASRSGHQAGYVGVVGTDKAGSHIRRCLEAESVDSARVRTVEGPTAFATVRLVDGNRVFGHGSVGVSRFTPTAADLDYLGGFDVIHTGDCSSMENSLEDLARTAPLSFDFSDKPAGYVEPLLAHLWVAEFSGSHLSDSQAIDLARWAFSRGPRFVLVTLGARGALLYDGTRLHHQGSIATTVVDTLGAGDAFIAHTLVGLAEGDDAEMILHEAARAASQACHTRGAFGHPAPSIADEMGTHLSDRV